MLQALFEFLGIVRSKPAAEPKPISRSTRMMHSLTDDEIQLVIDPMDSRPRCPDCLNQMLAGPRGCAAQNWACPKCKSEFNLTKIGTTVVMGERCSDPGKMDWADRRQFYEPAVEAEVVGATAGQERQAQKRIP